MEVSEAVENKVRVVVAAQNDMGLCKISTFRATKPYWSPGPDTPRLGKSLTGKRESCKAVCYYGFVSPGKEEDK